MSSDGESRAVGPSTRRGAVTVKSETKVKAERAAGGKSRARKAQVEDEDQEDEEEGDEDNEEAEQEHGSPRGNKRQRVNDNGDSRSSRAPTEDPEESEGEDEGENDVKPEPSSSRPKTLPRDVDGFIPGSIVRIQLQNFVTYDFVEFCPGPYLNMIVGPNGTGKSSIACAIALGLNFPPKVLGRSSELNAFVKIGTLEGYIEIELKSPAGRENIIVKRTLCSQNRKSSFFLNGQPATGNEVSTRVAELNVQVENLCSFLPQDKVSSFAHMTPQQLLVETQKAAGDAHLSSWFDTLKVEGAQLKIALQKLKEDEEAMNQMKERNANIENDVQQFKERQKLEQEIAILEVLVPITRFRELRQEYRAAKVEQRAAHSRMVRLKDTNEPAHKLLKKLEKTVENSADRREKQKKSMQRTAQTLKRKTEMSDDLDKEAEDALADLENLKKNEKERLKKIKDYEGQLNKLEEEMAKPAPKMESLADVQDDQRQINMEKSALAQEHEDLHREMNEVVARKVAANDQLDRAKTSLVRLDTTDAKKLNLLKTWDPAVHDAVLWLRSHRELFDEEVFEPPILSVSVPGQKNTAQIEAAFSGDQMKMFVAQNKKDLDTFNHHVNDTNKALGRRVRVPTWWRPASPNGEGNGPLTPEQMEEVGFEGYIISYLSYPPGMDNYLKKQLNLHRIAIVGPGKRFHADKAMEYYGNVGGGVFINGTTYNNVSRSRYGRKALGNMTREIRPAMNFVVPPVNMTEKNRLEGIIKDNEREAHLADERKKELQIQVNALTPRDKDIRDRLDAIKQRRDAINTEATRVQRLKAKFERTKAELNRLNHLPSADEEREQLKRRLKKIAKRRIDLAREYTVLAEAIYREQLECTLAGLQFIQAQANANALKEMCKRQDHKYEAAVDAFHEINDRYNKLKRESKERSEEAAAKHSVLDSETQDKLVAMEESRNEYDTLLSQAEENGGPPPDPAKYDLRTSQQFASALDDKRADLDSIISTNPGVLEEYEKRERDIEQRQHTIDQTTRTISKHNKKIKQHKDLWLPALQKLVKSIGQRFSAAFDRIGCAGEIRIREDDDFEQWAIEIYVKFRDTEKLQLLTGQRQSGGERSLTTILYLMSLTEEARAPFSLVDEINQGMDQRAERVVHNSMVDVTCKEDSAQYFLITPKLLTDLNYHERMKILCVNNGEWLPDEKGIGNMMSMINTFVAHRNGTRGPSAA